ncbi:helix-turn-helix transcriptional regulator [Nocardioides sp.]|uniref:helix-turn-helix domain-containing protein n=1 Tax=Nocardioides sp. TaxID=35761 RepID=UPI0031FEA841|nr:helix-turn-helix domain protein [Nocardioides sp.]
MGDLIDFPAPAPAQPSTLEPLWREAVGQELRDERHRAGRTLIDVAGEAGVSTQYLSEVERGRKEPSSEVLGAVAGALGLRLVDLTVRVSRTLRATSVPAGPVALAA